MERLVGITTYWEEEGQEMAGKEGAEVRPRVRSKVNSSSEV